MRFPVYVDANMFVGEARSLITAPALTEGGQPGRQRQGDQPGQQSSAAPENRLVL